MLARIGVAGAIAGNVMDVPRTAIYSGWFGHMAHADERYTALDVAWCSPRRRCSSPVACSSAAPGRHSACGRCTWTCPSALALAIGYDPWRGSTPSPTGPIYFDGVAMLIFLLLVGRFLQQARAAERADAAEFLHALSHGTRARDRGRPRAGPPAAALLPGMRLSLRPGDTVAADGSRHRRPLGDGRRMAHRRVAPRRGERGRSRVAGTTNRSSPLNRPRHRLGRGDAPRAHARRGGAWRPPSRTPSSPRRTGWPVGSSPWLLVLASLTWA
jgi:Cu2+-exporting ATPase